MRSLYLGLICLFLVSACKSEKSETPITEEVKELTIAEKIANAHGFKNWDDVSEIKFTFKVDRDTIKGNGRVWTWKPKINIVSLSTDTRNITYNQNEIDSTNRRTDQAFINDKFWLLVPFQLVWDNTATISNPVKAEAPISKTQMDMITITYAQEGGYTPGDAYDIFYGEDYLIKEWAFRRGNGETIDIANTFENYQDFNGIKIAIDHKRNNGKWNLNFGDVSVSIDN
ncbi:hypothetical protein [Winogradskyella immobilis]|uniref:Uncharacterized protein n=1 Tax=Winogradskyella immobilis TaxID=2816852 RepID=A0ABS8ELR3_9FLAO|nr:hypothetical protein [Winogradskyella immobilis]MCC1483962.1 hypothetical protein [Winogradskyella immobilis]MCG0016054.1 hypothetical protein [Winogradskyella immobilis]